MLPHLLRRSCCRWAVSSALWAAAFVPRAAAACSWAQVVLESSYPRQNEAGVPTNAVLFVYGSALLVTSELQLLDESGRSVAFEVQPAVPSGFDLAPLEELQPNQSYRLLREALPGGTQDYPLLTFTTGAGPAVVPESLNAPELDVTQFSYGFGSCGVLAGLCVGASSAPDTTLEVRVGAEVLAPVEGAPQPLSRAYGQLLSDDDCVEVRARDVRGHRSGPSTLCGDAILRFELRGDNFETAYTCDNYLDFVSTPTPENVSTPRDVTYVADNEMPSARSSRGCTFASNAPQNSRSAWLGLGLAVVATLARRRRR